MLTIRNPLVRDVELHCQCMDDNGIITGTRWFLPNMSIVSTDSSNRPYSTGTAPSRLLFSSPFTNSDTGSYTCSPNDTYPTIPSGDSITLNTAGKYVMIHIRSYILIYSPVDSHSQPSIHPVSIYNYTMCTSATRLRILIGFISQ